MSEPLKLVQPEPQQRVVDLLEERLADAKAGKLKAVAILAMYPHEKIEFGVSVRGFKDDLQALGALRLLESGFLKYTWRD